MNWLRPAVLLLLVWLLSAAAVFAGDAKELTKEATLTLSTGESVKKLTDGSYTSKWKLKGETVLTIEAAEDIDCVYLIWDLPPGQWVLRSGNRVELFGRNNFLHEAVFPAEASGKVTITLPKEGATLCEVRVFTEGDLPKDVQVWQPPYQDADMLLLPTHADDEHLFFGGTMPYYAGQLGMKVQVAYLTNHWGLREGSWHEYYRPHELLNGLWTVGITAYPIISEFDDWYSKELEHAKGLYANAYGEDAILSFQVELLRRFKPEVVLGHDINGEYGHGVHKLNTYYLQQALELSDDPAAFPESAAKYGLWEVQKCYLHLYKENHVIMDWDQPLSAFDGKTAFQMAEAGYAKHVSQQEYFSVRRTGVHDCRSFGLYWTTVGLDTGKKDFLENVTLSDAAKEPQQEPPKEPVQPPAEPQQPEPKGFPWGVTLGLALVLLALIGLVLYQIKKGNKGKRKNRG